MPKVRKWAFANGYCQVQKPEIVEGNELEKVRLVGYVYDDKRYDVVSGEFENGHRIITSPAKEINLEGKYVITRSGTKYELDGNMNDNYAKWLENQEEINVFDIVPKLLN